MFNNTFSFSNSGAHFLSNSLALLFIPVLGYLFLDNPAVLHVRQIIALFFMLQITLVLSNIISLCFSSLMANLLMFSVALFLILSLAFLGVFGVTFLFIFCVTFLLIFSFTLLLWNRFSPGNLYSMTLFSWLVVNFSVPHSLALLFVLSGALFIIRSHFMWYLNSITFLSRFIPTLFFPNSITGRHTTVGTTNQNQESQYLHTSCEDCLILPM